MGYIQAAFVIVIAWGLVGVPVFMFVTPLVDTTEEASSITTRLLMWSIYADTEESNYGFLLLPLGFLMEVINNIQASDPITEFLEWINPFHSDCILVYIDMPALEDIGLDIEWFLFVPYPVITGDIMPEVYMGWCIRPFTGFITAFIDLILEAAS